MYRVFFLLAVSGLFLCVLAQGPQVQAEEIMLDFNNRQMTIPLPVERDKNQPFEHYFSKKFDAPVEPPYKKITFLKQAPPRYLGERVERLAHGIDVDIPPEYDYYGYEIRRYMKSILTPSELTDPIKLTEEIANAKRARIIMDYWQRDLSREMAALSEIIENTDVTSRVRTTFRYNESKVSQFIPEMFGWIDRNIDFMEFLLEHRGEFFVEYPLYMIPEQDVRVEFLRLYQMRDDARKRIVTNYSPFRAMIY